jgi:uncharacterized protein YdiU (UPF0061 family)
MHKNKADYTNTFCFLMNEKFSFNEKYNDKDFIIWKKRWDDRLKLNNSTQEKYLKLMRSVNPLVIPRNHKVEDALKMATDGNTTLMKDLIKILEKPYDNQDKISEYQFADSDVNQKYQTFCGT